jgi:hypothetical protein
MTTTTIFDGLQLGWTTGNRITVSAATSYAIGNGGFTYSGRFIVTTSTSVPAADPRQCDMVQPGERVGLSLVSGDYLWLAADDPRAVLTVMAQAE